MKIYREDSLSNFKFWSGAKYTAETLWEKIGRKAFDTIENEFEMEYPDGMDETQINDIFWFETDYIATLLGYRNWEHLENGDKPIKILCDHIIWDVSSEYDGTEEVENLPTDLEIIFDVEVDDYFEAKANGNEKEFVADCIEEDYGWRPYTFEMEEDDK